MDASELQAKIEEAIDVLNGFVAMGGSMVTDAIDDFKHIKEIVASYPDCDLSPVESKIRSMHAQFGPYKSMAPAVGDALDALISILD